MKPSLTYMKGGMERGDIWIIGEDKSDWLYKGNTRSDFERFKNDFWVSESRGDGMFFMMLVVMGCFVFAGIHHLLKSPHVGVFLMTGVSAAIIFLFYSIYTFFRSLKKFTSYKKEYNNIYQKWIRIDSERRRRYVE